MRFRSISLSTREIVLVIDAVGTLTFGNEAVHRTLGRHPRIGGTIFENMHPEDRSRAVQAMGRLTADVARGAVHDFEVRVRHECGEWRWLQFTATNLLGDESVRGIVLNGRDVTARKRTEAILAETQSRLQSVLSGAAIGIWQFDLRTQQLQVDENCARLAGVLPASHPLTWADWERCVDRAQRADAGRWLRNAASQPSAWSEFEYRHHAPERPVRWLLIRACAETDAAGTPVRLAGILLDVDSRKRTELELAEREAQLETSLWSSKSAYWTIDIPRDRATMSTAFFALTGISPNEWYADLHPWNARMHPDDRPRSRLIYQDYIAGRIDFYECEYRLRTPKGWRWMHDRGRILARDDSGMPLKIGGTTQDASARKALEGALADAVSHEQQRLGYDLHDGLCQELVGIQFLLSSASRRLRAGRKIEGEEIEHIAELVRNAIGTARSIAHGLAPPNLTRGDLHGALQELAAIVSSAPNLRVHCSATDTPVRLVSEAVAEHLYRIAREAVNNACTHGNASEITITLHCTSQCLELSILDNGSGIDGARAAQAGIGLRIMAYRAQMTGSQFHVLPGPAGGVQVLVRCPLRESM